MLGVGVPRVELLGGDFDLWLPLYMLLSFLLIRTAARVRLTIATSVVAFVGGTLWAWSAGVFGVIPAGATAVLVAIAAGGIVQRVLRPQAGRD